MEEWGGQGRERPTRRPAAQLPASRKPERRRVHFRQSPQDCAKDQREGSLQVTEIDGHYNMPDKVSYACRLLRKAVGAHGARVVVMADRATIDAIDQLLWTLQPTEFIAHCHSGDEAHIVSRSPVVLMESGATSPPDRPILVNLGAELPARFERFE